MKKVALGMSGGVDSSAAAVILQNEGYEVIGITFKFVDDFDPTDAVNVCEKLGIKHYVLDYREEFKKEVIEKFVEDYKNGITPNPCILCNRFVKFKFLYDAMQEYNCDFLATGHYAKVIDGKLYKSENLDKDQTYFLCEVTKEQLSKIIFPLEGMEKTKVRELAKESGLVNFDKKDSFDVCFIKDSFSKYIKLNVKESIGDVIDITTNKKIGEHQGLSKYTIGQRRGLNIGGMKSRMFVVGKDINKNILYIATGDDNSYLISDSCIIDNLNLTTDEDLTNLTAKFRYRQEEIKVDVELLDDNKMLVRYKYGVKSVTKGQACALYKNDLCIGGGIIKEIMKNGKKLWYV